ncbi:23S rRNA (guanosine(2251)-2'-O)-methyltransferase RlmB [Paramagnetospirillum kuznetsovii]|uniref:23S rRNA (Guanosine(2251)-2'-O)-methyltransferase RlmB n=1 Tax=Paramagnetospirillum kuznetsovii TaxID=2053833 RepID=A0A364NVB4_9PROT|nr:23S rRNA (guanosine(2251)-2'-O)-methyltransferase RlmB [Paramagnetospirillum kuznetsovii]RAU21028.1 23S rRNA (guanosine(2251)-2'-O)-methyltransferase RlmB [Paramagnetospirillum kuznetsovii]
MKKRDTRTDIRNPRRGGDHRGPAPRGGGGGASFWIYGTHAAGAVLANPDRRIRRLIATTEAARGLEGMRLAVPVEPVERAEIDRLLPPGSVHQGLAVLVEPLEALNVEDVGRMAAEMKTAVVVVLDQVTDPHNVGAILRSAAAFGALAVVAPDRHAPEETGALAKAASGALERMPLVRVTNVVRALEDLKAAGFWTAGLAADAPKTLAEAKLSGKVVMVLGAEGEGLRRLTREHCDHLVRLPMTGAVESLNVSNACAVALYELARGS